MAFSSKFAFFKPGARLVTWRSMRKTQLESSRLEIQEEERENDARQQQKQHVSRSQSSSDLKFARLQPSLYEEEDEGIRVFGDFVSREAMNMIDDEYRAAAWLRAESHWEHQAKDRYALTYKRKFAEQEFNALKRRCKGYLDDHKYCTCIVTVDNKADRRNITRSASQTSIVGTLDLSIQHLLQGESYPGEKKEAVPRDLLSNMDQKTCSKRRYGYIANLCVARAARRRGIATNMLLLALKSANLRGADQVYAHVHRDNITAQQLYEKHGFEENIGSSTPEL